jgi:N-methylhydantoinase A
VLDRDRLRPGTRIDGPAVIEQVDSTTVILRGQTAVVDAYRNIIVHIA